MQVVQAVDTSEKNIQRWVKQQAQETKGNNLNSAERAELKHLRREVKTLRMEKETLKKASALSNTAGALPSEFT